MKFRFFILCFLFVLLFLGSVSAGENDTIEYDDFDWSDYGDYDDLVNEDAVDDDFDENDFNINDNDINLNESYDNDDPNPRSDIATTITASSITKYYRDGTQVYAYLKKSESFNYFYEN